MTAEELRQRVDDDIRAMLERSHQVGGGQGVVDHQRHAGVVRFVGDALDVEGQQIGVADGFGIDQLRLWRNRLAHAFGRRLAEVDLDPHLRQRVLELVVRAAVEAGRGDDLVAGVGDVQDGERLRRLAGGSGECADAALQRGDALLQHVGGRVHDPGVDVAERLQTEEAGGMLWAVEHVRRGLVDRHRPRLRDRIDVLPSMEGERLEPLLGRDDLGFAERCDLAVTHGFYSFFTFEILTVPGSLRWRAPSRPWVRAAAVARNQRGSSLDVPGDASVDEGTDGLRHLLPLLEKGVVTVRRVELVVLDVFAKVT